MSDCVEGKINENELNEIHCKLLNILKKFDAFCGENGLSYFIQSGTLLGAVREKGFIPWDDDADLVMKREDYIKLKSLFKDNRGEDYGLSLIITDRVPKITAVKDDTVHADIFLLDYMPKSRLAGRIKIFRLKFLQGMLKSKEKIDYSAYSFFGRLAVFATRCAGAFFTKKYLLARYEKVSCTKRKKQGSEVSFTNELFRFMDRKFPADFFGEIIRIPFEDTELNAPSNWDGYLKFNYGEDYMTPKQENYFAEENKI